MLGMFICQPTYQILSRSQSHPHTPQQQQKASSMSEMLESTLQVSASAFRRALNWTNRYPYSREQTFQSSEVACLSIHLHSTHPQTHQSNKQLGVRLNSAEDHRKNKPTDKENTADLPLSLHQASRYCYELERDPITY